jgi:predicted RNase H-like HicB family nuclease
MNPTNRWIGKMHKYAIEIFFSEEDGGYIAIVPELPGCSAFGNDEKSALEEVMTAMDLWLETAKQEGRDIPPPKGISFLTELKNSLQDEREKERSIV